MKKTMIFGAGFYGKLAFDQIGTDEVDFFIDNDPNKVGTSFCGKTILSPEQALEYRNDHRIAIASLYGESMKNQLEEMGFLDYYMFLENIHGFYESGELIVNPYSVLGEASSESEWSSSTKMEYSRVEVNKAVDSIKTNVPLFNHVEVETINRCNGVCSFCPVNRNADPREKAVMSDELFYSIVDQLEELEYTGRFTTFSNNEPLLDDRILEFNLYARRHLPKARLHMFTNGTLFNMGLFKELIDLLDELIIDNYRQDLKLIKPCEEIKEYCESHPELKKKVTIVLRKPNEILTSRGGNAPNRKELIEYGKDKCILPFKQLIIRPTGQVSLCCNDALGKYTLGDASKEKLVDIWYGKEFEIVRQKLSDGRENFGDCKYCDTFSMG